MVGGGLPLSRRRVLLMAAAAAVVAGAAVTGLGVVRRRVNTGTPVTMTDAKALETVVHFIGALFGATLTDVDRTELLAALQYALVLDEVYGVGFRALVGHLNQAARAAGAADFRGTSPVQADTIVGDLMRTDGDSALLAAESVTSVDAHRVRDVVTWVVPKLEVLYRRSGVPWRARGYQRWPGVAGNWTDYLTDTFVGAA